MSQLCTNFCLFKFATSHRTGFVQTKNNVLRTSSRYLRSKKVNKISVHNLYFAPFEISGHIVQYDELSRLTVDIVGFWRKFHINSRYLGCQVNICNFCIFLNLKREDKIVVTTINIFTPCTVPGNVSNSLFDFSPVFGPNFGTVTLTISAFS